MSDWVKCDNCKDAAASSLATGPKLIIEGKGNFSDKVEHKFTINKKTISVDADEDRVKSRVPSSKEYDGDTKVKPEDVTVVFDEPASGDTFRLDYDYTVDAAFSSSSVGEENRSIKVTVKLVATGPTAKNYTLSGNSFTVYGLSITKRRAKQEDFTHNIPDDYVAPHYANGKDRQISVSMKSGMSGYGTLSVLYDGEARPYPKDAGNYAVSAKITGGTNFEEETVSLGSYTIRPPRPPVINTGTPAPNTTVREGQNVSLAVTAAGPVTGAALSYKWFRNDEDGPTLLSMTTATASMTGLKAVNSPYTFFCRVTSNNGGEIDSADSGPATVTVLPPAKPLSGAVVTVSGDYVYSGRAHEPDMFVTVTLGGEPIGVGDGYTVKFASNINAGRATVTVTGKDDYSGTATGQFAIAKSPLIPADLMLSKAEVPYSGSEQKAALALTGSGRTGLGEATMLYNGKAAIPVNAGDYEVEITKVAEGTNFLGWDEKIDMGTFRITKKTPAASDLLLDLPEVYSSGALQTAVSNVKLKGTGYGSLKVLFNGSEALPGDYGTYTVKVEVEGGDNYSPGTVTLPSYQIRDPSAVRSVDRVVHVDGVEAVVAPAAPASGLSAGPNPVDRSGAVNFYRSGWVNGGGSLVIYDAVGNAVSRVAISAKPAAGGVVGSWDLKDFGGRPVPEGSYLAKGSLALANGSVERVSLVVVVR